MGLMMPSPALFTRMSRRPSAATVSATRRRAGLGSAHVTGMPRTVPDGAVSEADGHGLDVGRGAGADHHRRSGSRQVLGDGQTDALGAAR